MINILHLKKQSKLVKYIFLGLSEKKYKDDNRGYY